MALKVPPMPGLYPYKGEQMYPCPFAGCNQKFKEKGDQEIHVIRHYTLPHASRDNYRLAEKAYARLPVISQPGNITPDFAPPPPQPKFQGRHVAPLNI